MNQISVFYDHICRAADQSGKTVEDVLMLAKQWGIGAVELSFGELKYDPQGIKAMLDRCGLCVSSLFVNFDFINDSAKRSAEKYSEAFRLVGSVGCKNVMCIPGFFVGEGNIGEQTERVCERIGEMCSDAEKFGITVLIEDYDSDSSPCCTVSQIKHILEGAENLKFVFDTGNFFYSKDDMDTAYSELKDRIVHCHLKDRSTKPTDLSSRNADILGGPMYSVPVGDGELSLGKWIKRLVSDGYEGTFTIEHFGLHYQLCAIERSAAFVKAALCG